MLFNLLQNFIFHLASQLLILFPFVFGSHRCNSTHVAYCILIHELIPIMFQLIISRKDRGKDWNKIWEKLRLKKQKKGGVDCLFPTHMAHNKVLSAEMP